MSTAPHAGAARFLEHLERARELRRQVVNVEGLTPAQAALSRWQTARLAGTYADFASQPRYKRAIAFFLEDLYGTRDFAQRDADIERVYPIMVRVLSENAMHSLSLAVELHALTQQLDSQMIHVLREELDTPLGAPGAELDKETYAEAYRLCDDLEARRRQIELVLASGSLLGELVRHPAIYVTARLARGPAKAAGFGELQDFIERGLGAFRRMKDATPFLDAIERRENLILEQIVSGAELTSWHADAFGTDNDG